MVVYISGKYSGKTQEIVKQNIEVARMVAVELWKMGYAVICPHLNTGGMENEGILHEVFIKGYIEILTSCDVILLLPGWKDSKGAVAEKQAAIENCIAIYEYPELPPLEKHKVYDYNIAK